MLRFFIHRLANRFYTLSNTNVIILGNQKSGTTAIAKLLSLSTGAKALLDTPLLWEPNLSKISQGKLSLRTIIESNKYYFARPIVKEPNLTFFFHELVSIYPKSVKFIFIVRDPRDNIRSLLNRVGVPGNLNHIDAYYKDFTIHEKALFSRQILPYASDHYIEQLAERWNKAVEIYLNSDRDIFLVRYEDFLKDKVSSIQALASKVRLKPMFDISDQVDIQYQPKGNREVSRLDFFGVENLRRIQHICGDNMQTLDYTAE